MKITDVIAHHLTYKTKHPYANSFMYNRSRSATVIEVRTENGLVGWGEGSGAPDQGALETHAIGESPFDYEVIYDGLAQGGRNARAACGVEIALWDLMGKALDKPVYELLGGARRNEVTAYASGLFKLEGEDHAKSLYDEASRYRDQGFLAVKMKIGFGREVDEEIVASVRKAIGPDIALAVDANCRYDVATAIDVGRRIDAYDLLWYEEPIAPQDVDGYCEIKQALPMRLAGAESLQGLRAYRELVQRRALHLIQPDISIAGGFTEGRRIWSLATAHHVRTGPHMWGGIVRLAATLHWQATLPDDPVALNPFPCYLEYDMTENGIRTDLSPTTFLLEDGMVKIPDAPGLGVEVAPEKLAKYAR